METKTNVMRLLEKQKINYIPHFYPHGDDIPTDGVTVAEFLGKDPASVYKTLVTRSASKAYYVFVVPVAEHHDGFQMYASDLCRWNAAEMGPKRDILGELKTEVEKEKKYKECTSS